MRVTKLDGCGRPVYGDCAQVVSKGFVSVEMSANTDDGEEISVTNAAGETCISEKGCATFNGYDVKITFCAVDPDLVTMINPTWVPIKDAQGRTIGYDAIGTLDCSTGYALEVWMDVAGSTDACTGSSGAQGAWGYLLLPYLTGGAPGDLTVENDAVSFEFNGSTKGSVSWGSGPYSVEIVDGVPSPLRTPVTQGAHYRLQPVDVAPPAAQCGCQAVARPLPPTPAIYIEGIDGESPRRTANLRVDNHGFGPVLVNWGDGTPVATVQDGVWTKHTYASDGEYTITASDQQTPVVSATRDVTIPLPPDDPAVALSVDESDATRQTVKAEIVNHGNGPVTVNWGDGTPVVDADDTASISHQYTRPGVFTVVVTDADEPEKVTQQAVSVPVPADPVFTVEKAVADVSGKTAKVTGDDANGTSTAYYLDWGDGSARETVLLASSNTYDHAYADDGEYAVVASRLDNELAASSQQVTIPFA